MQSMGWTAADNYAIMMARFNSAIMDLVNSARPKVAVPDLAWFTFLVDGASDNPEAIGYLTNLMFQNEVNSLGLLIPRLETDSTGGTSVKTPGCSSNQDSLA